MGDVYIVGKEINTGKKWIDGNYIYRQCFYERNKYVSSGSADLLLDIDHVIPVTWKGLLLYSTDTNADPLSISGSLAFSQLPSSSAWVQVDYNPYYAVGGVNKIRIRVAPANNIRYYASVSIDYVKIPQS